MMYAADLCRDSFSDARHKAIQHEMKRVKPGTCIRRACSEHCISGQMSRVLVLACESTDEAARMLAELPFVREGLISFELIPLQAYPGFARLFK